MTTRAAPARGASPETAGSPGPASPRGARASRLERRLRRELEGEVRFDRLTRGLYSTDASIYQISPVGVVIPRTVEDIARAMEIAREEGIPITPRGAGTSQGGQAIGSGLVIDTSEHLDRVVRFDPEARVVEVEPGIVLDRLNAFLRPHGLWFPIDVATASRATLGGMAGNNSAGARSIRYGQTVEHVRAIEAVLADGRRARFGFRGPPERPAPAPAAGAAGARLPPPPRELAAALADIYRREADELARRIPRVPRHVAGYNLHRLGDEAPNLARILVGSEGTLAFFTRLELALSPILRHRTLGVCHFGSLHEALDAVRDVVTLGPSAVELIDRPLLDLAARIPAFRDSLGRFVKGTPAAILLVELAGEDADSGVRDLERLEALMGDLGHPGSVTRAIDPGLQAEIWDIRKAGLNIVMSMKGDTKPVAFIEDCAIPLERLAEWGDRITELFARHGTEGIWYAHASVGTLHVRPALNLKDPDDVWKMRAIAEEAFLIARELGGSHSGEHGDGIIRGEFLEPMLGPRIVEAFRQVKRCFDPERALNPGRIVDPPRMDDRTLFRYFPDYRPLALPTALDWSEWGGFTGAVEMCNNNGACRALEPGVMCPSYRATRDERHTTRGRANALRLALTGQLGPDALSSTAMYETLDLCIGCKACRRECPTGVDMARMKIEFLHAYRRRHPASARDRLLGYLPRLAPWGRRLRHVLGARERWPWVARLGERALGIAAARSLPVFDRHPFRPPVRLPAGASGESVGPSRSHAGDTADSPLGVTRPPVVLFVDTFSTWFEPDNARATLRVLEAAGYDVTVPAWAGGRPLCCGRTFLSAGFVEEARVELARVIDRLGPPATRGIPIVGIEPSCLLTLRDELPALFPGPDAVRIAEMSVTLAELLVEDGRLERLELRPLPVRRARVHGHCHEKAFGGADAVSRTLASVPGLEVDSIEAGCCGMAGSFGYEAEHFDLSLEIGELDLLPAVREAADDVLLVADGTSCRHQIADATDRRAVHIARALELALADAHTRT